MSLQGYLRQDGRKGIRNTVIVAYMVECARHVAQEIVLRFPRPGRASHRVPRLLPERVCGAA